MKKNNLVHRVLAFSLCCILAFTTIAALTPETKAQTLSGLQSEQTEIKEKIKASEDKIAQLESQKAKQNEIVDALNAQIDSLNAQLSNVHAQQAIINNDIAGTQGRISELNDEIAGLDKQIALKDKEIEETIELFCQRMKANYMAGNTSVLEMFTASDSLPGFFNRLELFRRVTTNDQKLVDKLNEEIASIKKMQDELREKQDVLKAEKTILENKQGELRISEQQLNETQAEIVLKSNEVNKKLASLNYQTRQLNVSIDQYNAEMDKIDKEIEAYLKAKAEEERRRNATTVHETSGGSSSGNAGSASSHVTSSGWAWPVPYDSSYISSPYGYRSDPISGSYKFHSGIDITMSGAYGKKLVATKAGTVDTVIHSGSGYGNYVIIDHGDGWASLYGHCSSTAVYEGQHVDRGQIIAYIGESGYATGPHVHFEIRYYGEKVNPSDYVSRG